MKLDRTGFTLLELIIVLFLITLMLGLSSVFFANTLPTGRFNATAREIAATMRQAKHLAQRNGEKQIVIINMDAKSYGMEGQTGKTLPSGIFFKIIDPLAGELTRGSYPIAFQATGSTEGGTVILWNNARVARIDIDPVAGAVIIR
ncbi:MAG: prepilin-type N-terminal cleavage/methylation domain-containing protein [Nitrospirae bacterium]|nr:prepilin-type N-terminal cleavage/methylation domain-containing protein [Nitrospirota bacterium]